MNENFLKYLSNALKIKDSDKTASFEYKQEQYTDVEYKFSNDPEVNIKLQVIAHAMKHFKYYGDTFHLPIAHMFYLSNIKYAQKQNISEFKNCEIFWDQFLDYRMFKYNTKLQ